MKKPYDKHLFICESCVYHDAGERITNGGSCLKSKLKEQVPREYLKEKNYRISGSGCLGNCRHGINAVIYPEGKFFTDLSPNEETLQTLKEELLK